MSEQTIYNAERYSFAFSELYKPLESDFILYMYRYAHGGMINLFANLIAPSSTLDKQRVRQMKELYADVEEKLEAVRTLTSNLQQLFENVNVDGITLLPKDYHQFTKEQEIALFNSVEDMSKFGVLINSKLKKPE